MCMASAPGTASAGSAELFSSPERGRRNAHRPLVGRARVGDCRQSVRAVPHLRGIPGSRPARGSSPVRGGIVMSGNNSQILRWTWRAAGSLCFLPFLPWAMSGSARFQTVEANITSDCCGALLWTPAPVQAVSQKNSARSRGAAICPASGAAADRRGPVWEFEGQVQIKAACCAHVGPHWFS